MGALTWSTPAPGARPRAAAMTRGDRSSWVGRDEHAASGQGRQGRHGCASELGRERGIAGEIGSEMGERAVSVGVVLSGGEEASLVVGRCELQGPHALQ